MTIKAIETVYNGYRFRSRLEARWAVFFDRAGIKYEYEKEDFNLEGTRYLPDFWLPEQRCHIEIKGKEPTEFEKKKAVLLAQETFNDVHIFYGEIEIPNRENYYKGIFSVDVVDYGTPTHFVFFDFNSEWGWAQCPWCLLLDITYHSNISTLPCGCYSYIQPFMHHSKPLDRLVKHCPDLLLKEPRYDGNIPYYKQNYVPAIQRWWKDKCHALTYGGDSPRLIAAYTAARQARFEHGESGAR